MLHSPQYKAGNGVHPGKERGPGSLGRYTGSRYQLPSLCASSSVQADYPLLDPPLIIALVSDYDADTVSSHIEEIRDQLGVLEASMVPDDEEAPGSELAHSAGGQEEAIADSLNSLGISTSPGTSSESSGKERDWSNDNDAEASGSGSKVESSVLSAGSEMSTIETSIGDEEPLSSLDDDVAELKVLFPDL